jgi:hypothetical protein
MEEFVIKSKLVEQGWTDALVTKFLPEPDQIKSNPHYRLAAPMKLYLKERVERIEATDQFKEAKEKSSSRKRSAQKAVESKISGLDHCSQNNSNKSTPCNPLAMPDDANDSDCRVDSTGTNGLPGPIRPEVRSPARRTPS